MRLRQVLGNLASNAVKFTHQGGVSVSVRAEGERLLFSVSDTGIGFSSADRDKLFAPFSQADASITRRFGGTGLGLAICRELIAAMGGELQAESQPSMGSTFSFALPLQAAQLGDQATSPEKPIERDLELRVLAAEDNPVNQLVLRSILEPLGVQMRLVSDGEAAVQAFAEERFDVVLMDVQMPGMNGIEATRRIRRMEQEHRAGRTPIIALSANVMAHQLADYQEAGMDGHVAKPISIAALHAKLSEFVA